MAATIEGAKRQNMYVIDPWQVRLIWDDSDERYGDEHEVLLSPDVDLLVHDGEKHPLYDDRVLIPRNDARVAETIKNGIEEPIIGRKNGELIEVVEGRQRVLDMRAANLAIDKSGGTRHRIRVILKRGADLDAMKTMVRSNEWRTPDEVFNKAKKANRLQEFGASIDEIATEFGVTTNTVKNWLKLLEMDDKVQKAARVGQVTITEAIKWSKEPREVQVEMLKAHKKATKTRASDPYKSGNKGKKGNGSKTGNKTQVKAPGKAKIRLLIEALPESKTKAALQWAVGDISTKKAKESIKELK